MGRQRLRAQVWGRPRGRSDPASTRCDPFRPPLREDARVGAAPDGEEPDMDLAANAPEQSELYLPGIYERRHLGAMGSAKGSDPLCHLTFQVCDSSSGVPVANEPFVVETGSGQQYAGTTDNTGRLHYALVPPDDYRLEIAGAEMYVPALGPNEPERVLAYYPEN